MADPPRFFVDAVVTPGALVPLPREVHHHALRVLRLAQGDAMVVFNGRGGEFTGRLQTDGPSHAAFLAEVFEPREAELPFSASIVQGLCASDKMDWLIEKCVELGAAKVVPLALEKSVVKLTAERAEKRVAHWQNLIVAASQQCGRNRLMAIESPTRLPPWLGSAARVTHRLVLAPGASMQLSDFALQQPRGDVDLLIGPEAGLTQAETDFALAAGFLAVGLGARTLRTETAALVALATLNAHWA